MMFVNVSCILPIHTRSVYSDSIGVRGVNVTGPAIIGHVGT